MLGGVAVALPACNDSGGGGEATGGPVAPGTAGAAGGAGTAGASGTGAAPAPVAAAPEVRVEIPESLSIRVLEAGAEPRATLRFEVPEGTRQTVHVGNSASGLRRVNGLEVPQQSTIVGITMSMGLTAAAVTGGEQRVDFVIDAVEPRFHPRVPEAGRVRLTRRFAATAGTSGGLMRGANGVCRVAKDDAPVGVMPPEALRAAEHMQKSVAQSMDVLTLPVPDEPVGVGARWEVVSPQERNGVRLRMTRTYELLARDGAQVSVAVVVNERADAGEMRLPGFPPNASARLASLSSSGSGRLTARLDRIVPEEATLVIDAKMSVNVSEGGQRAVLEQESRMEFDIQAD